MKKYVVYFGCYLQREEGIVETNMSEEALSKCVYEAAYEITEGWLGSHGFECECSTEDEDGGWDTIQEGGECCHMTVEEACDYSFEEYDEETHGNDGLEVLRWG